MYPPPPQYPQNFPPQPHSWRATLVDKWIVILIDYAVIAPPLGCCIAGLGLALAANGAESALLPVYFVGYLLLAIVDAAILASFGCFVGGAIRRVRLVDIRTGGPAGFGKALLFKLIMIAFAVIDLGLSSIVIKRELLSCQITGTRYIRLPQGAKLPVGPIDRLPGLAVKPSWEDS